jgi:glycosyltransferase involved in cell wall biosynthesis
VGVDHAEVSDVTGATPDSATLASATPGAAAAMDPELALLVPSDDEPEPELTILVPALDEALTIGRFVQWCRQGLERAGVRGEILIVDSSSDDTARIALEHGARVLKAPKRGLGRAYIDAIPFVRGTYVVAGDCDCTYDFRELGAFVERFREGSEFVMGSRFRGYIEPGAMPALHRYFGTPLTTGLLNVMFGSRFTDIHCGMRGITREALGRMDLQSQSWEYASEMVLKSVHMGLRTSEVPIRFLKDPEGRVSHHKRSGWLSPWKAGWINLRAMFVYGASFFLYKPGFVLLALGLLLTLPQAVGSNRLGPITLSLHWMLLGLTLAVLGLQSVYLGVLAQVLFDYTGAATERWLRRFRYSRSVILSALSFVGGLCAAVPLSVSYARHGWTLPDLGSATHLAVLGLLLMIGGFMTFAFTLMLHSTAVAVRRRR